MSLPQQNNNTQPKSSKTIGAVPGEGGYLFEMNMAAIAGLRGMQRADNFKLSSNTEGNGNFDDLVYREGGRRYYLQLKHSYKRDEKLEIKKLKKTSAQMFPILPQNQMRRGLAREFK